MFFSNFLGILLVGCVTFSILVHLGVAEEWLLAIWLITLLSCQFFLMNARQGLESPLHLGIILLCVYFFLVDRPRSLCLLSAAAIISKLDALPIVAVLLFFQLLRAIKRGPISQEMKAFLLLFIIPLVIWVAFAIWFFGSPMPQSAQAKLYYHQSGHSLLHFLVPLFRGTYRIVSISAVALLVVAILWRIARGQRRLLPEQLIFLWCALGYLMLYCVFNPTERMSWYYVVPEFLLILQVIVLWYFLLAPILDSRAFGLGAVGLTVFGLLVMPVQAHILVRTGQKLDVTEGERAAIGRWIKVEADAGDKLLSGHGHIARESGMYVYDYSGLNSKRMTAVLKAASGDRNQMFELAMSQLQPNWIVGPGHLPAGLARDKGYSLVRTFYNISVSKVYQAWRVYRWNQEPPLRSFSVVPPTMIRQNGNRIATRGGGRKHFFYQTDVLSINFSPEEWNVADFRVGLFRKEEAYRINASFVTPSAKERCLEFFVPAIDSVWEKTQLVLPRLGEG